MAGLGLFLLRLAAAAAAFLQGSTMLEEPKSPLVATAYIVCACAILAGFMLTWFSAASALLYLTSVFGWLPAARLAQVFPVITDLLCLLVAVALLLLGPGAHSLDAKLFGRREVIIPERKKGSMP